MSGEDLAVAQHRADLLRSIANLRKELDALLEAVRQDVPEVAVTYSRRLGPGAAEVAVEAALLWSAHQRATSRR